VALVRAEAAERELLARAKNVQNVEPLNPGEHVNASFLVKFKGGTYAVYKPRSGEEQIPWTGAARNFPENNPAVRIPALPPGRGADREVAAYRTDRLLEFNMVPTTTIWGGTNKGLGAKGPGSLQSFERSMGPKLPPERFTRQERERMAVLDYVTGNTDRHNGNYLMSRQKKVIPIDHGNSFPETYGVPLRSDFLKLHLDKPLERETLQKVRSLSPAKLREMLRDAGIGSAGAEGAVERLQEIQRHGRITGEAWKGIIHDARKGVIREAISDS
jgi:hypothetical protein